MSIKLALPLEIIMLSQAADSFKHMLESGKEGLQQVLQSLTDIDTKTAEASYLEDKMMVKNLIQAVCCT